MLSKPHYRNYPLVVISKTLASIISIGLLISGIIGYIRAVNHHETHIPGAFPEGGVIPTAFINRVMSIITIIWTIPQIIFLPFLLRNRAWAFMILSVLFILQGAPPAMAFVISFKGKNIEWTSGLFGISSIAIGVLLIISSRYLPSKVLPIRGFPIN